MTSRDNIMGPIESIENVVDIKNERKLERKSNFAPYLVFGILLVFGLGVRLWHINHSPLPFSLDPFYHMATSASIVETGNVSTVAYSAATEINAYPPLLPLIGAAATKIGIGLVPFYRYFSLITTVLIAVLLLIFLRNFFPPWPSVLGAISYISLPYVVSRTILTLPENLSMVFVLLTLTLLGLYTRQKSLRGRILTIAAILGVIALNYFTHYTYLLSLMFVAVFMILKSIEKKRYLSLVTMLAIAIIAVIIALPRIPSSLGFQWPDIGNIRKNFGEIAFWVGDIGLIAAFIICLKKQKESLVLLFATTIPLILGWFFFRGQGQGLGQLEPERWLMFASIAIAIGIAATFYILLSIKWQAASAILTVVIAVVIFWPRWSNAWPQPYNDAEYEAAIYIQNNLPSDALYFSQPILEWLLRGVAHRYVIIGYQELFDNIGKATYLDFATATRKYDRNSAYIVFSENPNYPGNLTLLSDGSEKPFDFSGVLETPGINKSRFNCLQKVWTNGTVTIYKLPLDNPLADTSCLIPPYLKRSIGLPAVSSPAQ